MAVTAEAVDTPEDPALAWHRVFADLGIEPERFTWGTWATEAKIKIPLRMIWVQGKTRCFVNTRPSTLRRTPEFVVRIAGVRVPDHAPRWNCERLSADLRHVAKVDTAHAVIAGSVWEVWIFPKGGAAAERAFEPVLESLPIIHAATLAFGRRDGATWVPQPGREPVRHRRSHG